MHGSQAQTRGLCSKGLYSNKLSMLKGLDQLPAKQRCMVLLDPAGVTSGSREMKEKRKEAEKEGLKVLPFQLMHNLTL